MKKYILIFIYIFLSSCSSSSVKQGQKPTYKGLDFSMDYSFNEYVNILLKNNKFKSFPDINIFLVNDSEKSN